MKIKVSGVSNGFTSTTDYDVDGSWDIADTGVLMIYGAIDDRGNRRCIAAHAAGQWTSVVGEPQPPERPKGAFIEIVEKVKPGEIDGATIFPTEIRINGTPVLAPAGEAVIVHEMSVPSDDLVKVTMTVFARRVSIFHEEKPAGEKP